MATLSEIATALAGKIDDVTSLRAYARQPDTIAVGQGKGVAFPLPQEGTYHESFDGTESTTWHVVILAAPESIGYDRGQAAIDAYLSKSGSSSVKAAIEADGTLGGVVDTLVVMRWFDRGLVEVSGLAYWGAKLEVTIWD